MTLEECTIRLSQIDNEYQKAKREVEEKHKRDRAVTLNAWANDNAAYHIGDIIEANGTAIVVERILGHRSEWGIKSNTYCVYQGHALTKRLQPRKDEWVTTIHDDGSREIKLLRKAKEDWRSLSLTGEGRDRREFGAMVRYPELEPQGEPRRGRV